MARTVTWLVDCLRALGTVAESWKARKGQSQKLGREDTPQLLQKADRRSDAQEEQSENITDGLSQRRRGSQEGSLDMKDRDEPTGVSTKQASMGRIEMSRQGVSTT